MITDPPTTAYDQDYWCYIRKGLTHDDAVRLAGEQARRRTTRARKADTARTCAWTGAALIIGVLTVAAFTFVA